MPVPFSVMTWNVENLFLPGHEPGPETAAIFGRKLRNLAATLSAVAPDIVALQEVAIPKPLPRYRSGLAARTLMPNCRPTPTGAVFAWASCRGCHLETPKIW